MLSISVKACLRTEQSVKSRDSLVFCMLYPVSRRFAYTSTPFRLLTILAGDMVSYKTPRKRCEVEKNCLRATMYVTLDEVKAGEIWLLIGNVDYSVIPNNRSCYWKTIKISNFPSISESGHFQVSLCMKLQGKRKEKKNHSSDNLNIFHSLLSI